MSQDANFRTGRILHLIDSDGPGGAETIFSNLVVGLEERGWESLAAVTEEGWSSRELRRLGVQPRILGDSGGWDLRLLRQLWSLIRRERVDLLQAHFLGPALYGSVAGRLRDVPSVATFHGSWDFRHPGALLALKRRIMEACLDTVVFVSAALRDAFRREVGEWSVPGRVIPNGIDVSRFSITNQGNFRADIGVGADHFLVGTVGNIRPAKSHHSFLSVAARLRDQDDRYRFVLVGDTSVDEYEDLRAMRDRLGLQDRFIFTGYREDIAEVMEGLDVFVLTSSSEGFSLTTVEAMASGLPVVATRCGGPEEIIDAGRTGMLVDVDDVEGMVRRIEELRRSPATRKKVGVAARRHVASRYSVTAMLDAYERLYGELLGSASADRRA